MERYLISEARRLARILIDISGRVTAKTVKTTAIKANTQAAQPVFSSSLAAYSPAHH
jgi:hypothetical protein